MSSPFFALAVPVLLLLAAVPATASEDTLDAAVFEAEDECLTGAAGDCALNAIQIRGSAIGSVAIIDNVAPDGMDVAAEGSAEVAAAPQEELMFRYDDDEEVLADAQDEEELEEEEEEQQQQNAPALLGLTPVDKIPITGCHGSDGKSCPEGETCIVKSDNTWSQCVDCSAEAFGRECQKLDDPLRFAAVTTCKRTCLDTKCYNSKWCHDPYRCIVDKVGHWGQCISCHSKKFWTSSCYALTPSLRQIASRVCHRRCGR